MTISEIEHGSRGRIMPWTGFLGKPGVEVGHVGSGFPRGSLSHLFLPVFSSSPLCLSVGRQCAIVVICLDLGVIEKKYI